MVPPGRNVRLLPATLALAGALIASATPANAETGALSGLGCLSGDNATAPRCSLTSDPTATGDDSGLDALQSIAISPDGESAYATSQGDDAIVHLDRVPATGAVSLAGCITFETATAGSACSPGPVTTGTGASTGLDAPADAVVSPDGSDVYAVSQDDDAIVHFDRNTTTGALSYVACASTETATVTSAPCFDLGDTAGGVDSGLDSPTGIAISAGPGISVYVTSGSDDAIARFTRNPTTGALSYDGCLTAEAATGSAGTAACGDLPAIAAGGTASGFDNPFSPAVSADGDNVYVATDGDDGVAWFDRGPAGALTWNDCYTGETGTGPSPGGNDACSLLAPSGTATGAGSGMSFMQSVVIGAGDDSVYAGSQGDNAVNHFQRQNDGDLSIDSCLTGGTSIPPGSCPQIPSSATNGEASGLAAVQGLAVSPDGKSLYVAAFGDDAIATFDLDLSDGTPSWDSCLSGEQASGPAGSGACAAPAATVGGDGSGLNAVRDVAVSSDGLQVLGATSDDATLSDAAVAFATRSTAPETTMISTPPALTNNTTPTFTFLADEIPVSFQCRIDGGAWGACSGLLTHTTFPLADGPHTFSVRARNDVPTPDPTPAVDAFTVDATAPETSIDSGPEGAVADPTAEFAFSAAGASGFECRLDGAPFAPCTSPQTYPGLAEGEHTFEVRATDAAGNTDDSPASRSFEVDTDDPVTTLKKKPKKTVKTNKDKKNAKFKFESDDGASFECKRDKGKDFKHCTSPYKKKYGRGKHTFKVRAIDDAGNVGAAVSHTWKVNRKG